jgi:hypothetical protein
MGGARRLSVGNVMTTDRGPCVAATGRGMVRRGQRDKAGRYPRRRATGRHTTQPEGGIERRPATARPCRRTGAGGVSKRAERNPIYGFGPVKFFVPRVMTNKGFAHASNPPETYAGRQAMQGKLCRA